MTTSKKPIDELLHLMERLRGPQGCPWDRQQTHQSLKPYVVEEAFELVEAIEGGRDREIKEELGDLLLQIVFHSRIAAEKGQFGFDEVVMGIMDKLVRRHPHVFGGPVAHDEEEALQNWERIKAETEGKRGKRRHPRTPILHRALRMQEKAVSFGFDWEETSQLLEKLEEEIHEVREALDGMDREKIVGEVGDLLFMTVNLARFLEIHPEDALERSMDKFSKRFQTMENLASADSRTLAQMDLEEMEHYWQEAKKKEHGCDP